MTTKVTDNPDEKIKPASVIDVQAIKYNHGSVFIIPKQTSAFRFISAGLLLSVRALLFIYLSVYFFSLCSAYCFRGIFIKAFKYS